MPITFADGWNSLNLSKLKKTPVGDGENPYEAVRNIASFWIAKTRMKRDGPVKVAALDLKIASLAGDKAANVQDPTKRFTSKMGKDLEAASAERTTIQNALDRGKVTSSMVKKFSPGLIPGLTKDQPRLLDPVMEQIHNDRLRIADASMLKEYGFLSVRRALIAAKSRFTQDPKVAALLARAVAADGEAVKITQGVHQSDDPHFDVLMVGEAQQYHVEVTLGRPLVVRSISYMLGAKKADGTRSVPPDGEVIVDVL